MANKKHANSLAPMTSLIAPHGPHWAIYEPAARQLLAMMRGITVAMHMEHVEERTDREPEGGLAPEARAAGESGEPKPYEFRDGIAYISLVGPMTKAPTSFEPGCSTVRVRRLFRMASSDPDVKGILLRIDSPGGSVSGTADLAADVAAIARRKPVYAYCEDMCCSAAYWVASQCTKVYANETGLVGSIGTLLVVEDWSRLFEEAGVEVLVFGTGDYKGAGVLGSKITEPQRTDFKRLVHELNEHFLGGVARGRGLSRESVLEVADGRVWVGVEAQNRRLIDAVASLDDCAFDLAQHARVGVRMAGAAHEFRTASEELQFLHDVLPDTAQTAKAQLAAAIRIAQKHEAQVSGEQSPRRGMTLADESTAALTAVQGLTTRIADIAQSCASEGRPLNKRARSHVEAQLASIRELMAALPAASAALAALLEDPDARLRQALEDAVLRDSLAAVTP